ncbi:MAG: polysaccharide deacetylase family protein [Lachnospiraceae bacterium]|nr:polysaccharide deacetylase family protein [Lachnospiraceae bacterium]
MKKVFQKIRHNFQDAAHIVRILMVVALGIGAIAVSAMYLSKEAVTADSSHVVNGRALPIYCVETDAPKIALTFDAAWGNEDTADILAILAKHDVKVTFFMTGGWIENYPEDVKAIYEAGHDLGNHSQTHPDMATISTEEIRRELMGPYESVKELTGYEMSLFRPPYGSYNNELIETASDCGFYTIQWDVDSLDWKDYGVDSIINTVCNHKHLGNGSIILCHNGSKYTAQALDTLITNLKAQGYEFVKLSELIYTDNYYMDHEGRQHPQQ